MTASPAFSLIWKGLVHAYTLANNIDKGASSMNLPCSVCIATFEPLIQVKSEAVDTGR